MSQISYSILAELNKKDNHIRGVASVLSINQMTALRKIKELEEKNVLDFRIEGKNKVYFMKTSLETTEHLKIMEHFKKIDLISKYPRIRKITEIIKKNPRIFLAVLFGSFAKKTHTNNSDIDVYIETSSREIKKILEKIDSKLSVKIGEFDINNLLIKEIMKQNIILKGVDRYYELIHKKTH